MKKAFTMLFALFVLVFVSNIGYAENPPDNGEQTEVVQTFTQANEIIISLETLSVPEVVLQLCSTELNSHAKAVNYTNIKNTELLLVNDDNTIHIYGKTLKTETSYLNMTRILDNFQSQRFVYHSGKFNRGICI